MGRLKCQGGELTILNMNAKLFSQLIDEAACPSGACLIHLVIDNNTVSLDNKLRVLATNLDNICFRVYIGCRSRLCRNLVLYQVGANKAANQISP